MPEVVKYSPLYKWGDWGTGRSTPLPQISLYSRFKVLPSLPHVPLPTQAKVVPALANVWVLILETELSS